MIGKPFFQNIFDNDDSNHLNQSDQSLLSSHFYPYRLKTGSYLKIVTSNNACLETGGAIWHAGIELVKYLENNPNLVQNKRILELGCGCGLVGLVCATLGAKQVTLTDLDVQLSVIENNITLNQSILDSSNCIVSCASFPFGSIFSEIFDLDTNYDMVIATDIAYDFSLHEPILKSLASILNHNPNCRIIQTEEIRWKDIYSWDSYYDSVWQTYDWFFQRCLYLENVTSNLALRLPKHILVQSHALETVISAFSSWELDRRSGSPKPLVLAFTGPTGVGKSEMAFEIASSVFPWNSHKKEETVKGYSPCGLLEFRGEEFSEDSEALKMGPAEARRQIRAAIVEHLKKHGGPGVIVFDEARKIAPGVLDVLLPALDERGFILAPVDEGSPRAPRRFSTSNCVFIFIIDMNLDRIARMMLSFGGRGQVPATVIRQDVKDYLDNELERLKLGKIISDVVPFLPLQQVHLQQILNMKLEKLAASRRNEWWLDLLVEKEVQDYLVDPTYVLYKEFSNANSTNGMSLVFANSGGRALENAGPYKDLRAMINTYMMPWRKDKILHIGIASQSAILFQQKKYRFSATSTKQLSNYNVDGEDIGTIYMQWCSRSEELSEYITHLRDYSSHLCTESGTCSTTSNDMDKPITANTATTSGEITRSISLDAYFMSGNCETVWYGHFISGGRVD